MALFLSWKLDRGTGFARRPDTRLAEGERLGLFRLRSFSAAAGKAQAYLEPRSDLETILESVYDDPADLLSCRWIESARSG